MGMGHKAPASIYNRRFLVTDHACDRFRTRLPVEEGKLGNGTQHRSNEDIGNLIDSLVYDGIYEKKVHHIWDDGEKAKLIDIRRPENANDLWALVKTNKNPASQSAEVVVTLLYNEMVEESLKSGKWGALTAVVSTLRTIIPVKEIIVPDKPKPALGSILIRWHKKGDTESHYSEWNDVNSAETQLNKLRRDSRVDINSIKVFSEVVTEARIII